MGLSTFSKNIRNIMRLDAGINGDAQRIEQLVWILFLKIYDAKEADWEIDPNYHSIIPEECRWRNWANNQNLTGEELLTFINGTLFPTLKNLVITPQTPPEQAVVKTIFEDANQYMKDGVALKQVINTVNELDFNDYNATHAFGDLYENILKGIQSAGSAGEFYTPRALTDFMAQMIKPRIGEQMADFACGTGGFMVSWLKELETQVQTAQQRQLYNQSIYGIEKKQFPYMLCITNLLLHGLDTPQVFHTNSLEKNVLDYTGKEQFDVILMNPPYGGSENQLIQKNFPTELADSETADLFMVLIMYRLKPHGRAAVILPDGFLFGNDNKKQRIKEKLLREFNLHTIIRLPESIFAPYTSIATNILFFDHDHTEGAPDGFATKQTWFYRLDMPKGYIHFSKTKPMTTEHCQPIKDWWNNRQEIILVEGKDEKSRMFTPDFFVSNGFNFDQCKYPQEEQIIKDPLKLIEDYVEQRNTLCQQIDDMLQQIKEIL